MGELGDMSFWSLVIPPNGKPSTYEIEQTPQTANYVHITNAALPHTAAKGAHCLTIMEKDTEITIATLNKDTHPQHSLDFILDQSVVFRNHGPSPLHLLGYFTTADIRDMEDDDDEYGFGSDDEEDEDESDEEDEEAPPLVAMNGKAAKASEARRIIVQALKPSAKREEESSDDDDDEGDEGEQESGSEDDFGDLNSDDEIMEHDSDLSEGDEGEGDSDDEGEEEEEEEEEQRPAAKNQQGKRPAPAAVTPAAKKGKGLDGAALAKAPQSAPPKVQQAKTPVSTAKPTNEKEYVAALASVLRSKDNKTCPMAYLGTAVQRPAGLAKLGVFIKNHADLFQVDKSGQNVTLKEK